MDAPPSADAPSLRPARTWRAFALALLAIGLRAGMLGESAWYESVHYDESEYLYSGYRIWSAGDWSVSPHPPLARALAGLPLWLAGATDVSSAPAPPSGQVRTAWGEARAFVHANALSTGTVLRLGRAPFLALWAGLALLVWWAARSLYGEAGGWLSLGLYLSCPQLSTYGRVALTDLPLAAATLAMVLAAGAWWHRPSLRRTLLAGACAGAALASRHAGAVPVVALGGALLALVSHPVHGEPWQLRRLPRVRGLRALALAGVAAAGVLAASYGGVALPHYGGGAAFFGAAYFGEMGHPSYEFAGLESERGWWWYVPAAVLVKQSPAHLALLAAALGTLVWRRPWRMEWLLLAPAAALVAAAMASGISYAVRHVLPIWPLLYVLAGRLAASSARARLVAGGLLLAGAADVLRLHPSYHGYASPLAGGPAGVHRVFADNSVDAGEALGELDRWLERAGDPPVWLAYFGQGDPSSSAYGIAFRCLPVSWDSDLQVRETRELTEIPRLIAISAHTLRTFNRGTYHWLLDEAPVAQPGWSILIYDIHRRPDLLALVAVSHADGALAELRAPRMAERLTGRAASLLAMLRETEPQGWTEARPRIERALAQKPRTRLVLADCLSRAGWRREAHEMALAGWRGLARDAEARGAADEAARAHLEAYARSGLPDDRRRGYRCWLDAGLEDAARAAFARDAALVRSYGRFERFRVELDGPR